MGDITTIQISTETKAKLDKFKIMERQSYNDVIDDLIEDSMEVSEETKKRIKESVKAYKEGRFKTHEEVKKEFGL